jgi:hypothetical protein
MQGFLRHLWYIEGTESCVPILCAMSLTDLMVQYCDHGLLLLSHPTIPGWLKNHWHSLSIFCVMWKHISPSLVAKLPVHFHGSPCVWPTGIPRVAGDSSFVCWWLEWHFVGCFVFFVEVHCQATNTLSTYHKKWDRVWHFASEKDCATAFAVHKLVS